MHIRPATKDDLPFLRKMLYEAARWNPDWPREPIEEVLAEPMLLRYSLEQPQAADRVEAAVRSVLSKGLRTADIAREGEARLNCSEMGDAVVAAL